MNKPKDIQLLTGELSRLLESKDNLNEFQGALWDAGIRLEDAAMEKAKRAVETAIDQEIGRVKALLKEML